MHTILFRKGGRGGEERVENNEVSKNLFHTPSPTRIAVRVYEIELMKDEFYFLFGRKAGRGEEGREKSTLSRKI